MPPCGTRHLKREREQTFFASFQERRSVCFRLFQELDTVRRLVLKMSVSLDGFVCGPAGETDWLVRGRDSGATAWIADTLWQAGLHAMGSRTYHAMAGHWPMSRDPLAAPMNAIPKVVFTRQRSLGLAAERASPVSGGLDGAFADAAASWDAPQVANGDLATEIGRLKEQPGRDIVAHGGAGFAQSLARLGLVDEYRLLVHPVALGEGLRLFAALPRPAYLELASTLVFTSGVVAQVYRSA